MIISIDGKKYRLNSSYTEALKTVCMDQIREIKDLSVTMNSDKLFITYLFILYSVSLGMIRMLDEQMLHQFLKEIVSVSEDQ